MLAYAVNLLRTVRGGVVDISAIAMAKSVWLLPFVGGWLLASGLILSPLLEATTQCPNIC